MNRLFPVFAAIVAVAALSGCDKDKEAPKGGSDPVYADDRLPAGANRKGGGRMLVVDAPLSDAVGAAPGDLVNQGSRFFDGASRRSGDTTAVPGGTLSGGGTTGTRRFVWTTDDGRLSTDLNLPPPPLPDAHDYGPSGSGSGQTGAGKTLLEFAQFQVDQKFASVAPIMSRLGWKAAKPKGDYETHSPAKVTVHHTQGVRPMNEADTARVVKGIQYDHMYLREKAGKKDNFIDIGYHFLIAGDGRVVEGRHAEYVGAHAGGANTNNIGISMMGDFNVIKPNEAQIVSLTRLVTFLSLKYKKDPAAKGFLEPHQHYTHTDCPGKNMMAILEALRQKIDKDHDQIVNGGTPSGEFTPLTVYADANPSA